MFGLNDEMIKKNVIFVDMMMANVPKPNIFTNKTNEEINKQRLMEGWKKKIKDDNGDR